jgi:hypothetical protein
MKTLTLTFNCYDNIENIFNKFPLNTQEFPNEKGKILNALEELKILKTRIEKELNEITPVSSNLEMVKCMKTILFLLEEWTTERVVQVSFMKGGEFTEAVSPIYLALVRLNKIKKNT